MVKQVEVKLIQGAATGAAKGDSLEVMYPKVNESLLNLKAFAEELFALIDAIQSGDSGAAANAARMNGITGMLFETLKARLDQEYGKNQADITAARTETILPDRIQANSLSATKLRETEDANKIKLKHLAAEVIAAIAGSAAVNTIPAAASVTTETVAAEAVTRPKLSQELQKTAAEIFNDDSVLYAIVDKDGRCAVSVDVEGKLHVYSLELGEGTKFKETILDGVEIRDNGATGVTWAIIDANDRVSDLAIGEDGKILPHIIEDWKSRMFNTTALTPIVCWGDSLTGGAAGLTQEQLWIGRLRTLITNREIVQMGIGGETSATISMRQGGSHAMVNNITIPATMTPVLIAQEDTGAFKDNWGITVRPIKQQNRGVNPCTIAGIEGTITLDGSTSNTKWYFTRSTAGTEKVISRPTMIVTQGSWAYREHIPIIFMGTNGGYSSDGELIQQHRRMIEWSKNKEYLVIGMTYGSQSDRAAYENLMAHEFGRRFVNIREYLSTYGLADVGITPTTDDLSFMAAGKVPPSLLATTIPGYEHDFTHYNTYGHQVIAGVIYQRLVDLKII